MRQAQIVDDLRPGPALLPVFVLPHRPVARTNRLALPPARSRPSAARRSRTVRFMHRYLPRRAWRRVPLRRVRLFLEIRDWSSTESARYCRVFDNRRHDEPLFVVPPLMQVPVFGQLRAAAVRDAVPAQVAGTHVRGHDFEAADAGRASGSPVHRVARRVPIRPLESPCHVGRLSRLPRSKVKQPGLRAGVGLDLQRVVVEPADVESRGQTHDSRRPDTPGIARLTDSSLTGSHASATRFASALIGTLA